MKQTAVEWFESMLKNWDVLLPEIKKAIIEQAKEMEKEQIIKTAEYYFHEHGKLTPQQYYNETFKSE